MCTFYVIKCYIYYTTLNHNVKKNRTTKYYKKVILYRQNNKKCYNKAILFYIIKKASDNMQIIIILAYLVLTTLGLILVKLGSNTFSLELSKGMFNCSISWLFILGLICYIGSFIIFTFVLVRKFNLTYIMPITTGITQVLVILAGLVIFKEYVNIYQMIGIILTVVGVVLLNMK